MNCIRYYTKPRFIEAVKRLFSNLGFHKVYMPECHRSDELEFIAYHANGRTVITIRAWKDLPQGMARQGRWRVSPSPQLYISHSWWGAIKMPSDLPCDGWLETLEKQIHHALEQLRHATEAQDAWLDCHFAMMGA